MIWTYVDKELPEVFCKCEALVKRKDGNLQMFYCEYDPMLKMFLIPSITNETDKDFEAVHYWRAL